MNRRLIACSASVAVIAFGATAIWGPSPARAGSGTVALQPDLQVSYDQLNQHLNVVYVGGLAKGAPQASCTLLLQQRVGHRWRSVGINSKEEREQPNLCVRYISMPASRLLTLATAHPLRLLGLDRSTTYRRLITALPVPDLRYPALNYPPVPNGLG